MTEQETQEPNGDFVQSLARGLEVLNFLGGAGGAVSATQVAEKTGLNRATARRLLKTLEAVGYVRQIGREYVLSSKNLELGYHYLANLGISDLVAHPIERLSAALGEAVSVSIRDGLEILYVARARPARVMTVSLGVGARLPVWHTSMGRVLLSALADPEVASLIDHAQPLEKRTANTIVTTAEIVAEISTVRNQGWSMVDQELEWGLRSLAVPLRRDGQIVAALNVASANVGEEPLVTQGRILPGLIETSHQIDVILSQVPNGALSLNGANGQ